jgi:glycosyltransferase involved in cell wall biosynthesis
MSAISGAASTAPERGKIAIFAPSMAGGGAERGAVKLADGLVRRGFEVDLVLAAAEGPRLAEIPAEVRLVDLEARRVASSLPGLVRYLRREKPQGLASVLDHANVVALWARKLGRYSGRVVVIEQNTLSEAARNGKSRRDRMMPRLVRRFYPWADYVVGVSEGVADDLSRFVNLPAEKVRVIANPIVAAEIGDLARAPVDHEWFADGGPVFVAAGRLRPQKDFPTLLRALARVREARPARLVILGEGPERERLEALTRELQLTDDVSLRGATTNPYAFMARSTAFILSSRWEGLPTVLIEAMSCGAPVIATDCPSGPREILAGGRHGALVPVGDVDALAAAMDAALDGKLARPPVESWHRYAIDAVVDEYVPLLVAS